MKRSRPVASRLGSSWTRRSRLRPSVDRLEDRALMAVTITEFATLTAAAQPGLIRRFADSSVVFTEFAANKIGSLAADGKSVAFESTIPTPNSAPVDITKSGGFYWFTEQAGNKIGRLTLDGKTFTEFPVPTAASALGGIVAGSDGAVWFAENAGNKIGRIASDGTITEFPVPTSASGPTGIVSGPLGDLYFTEISTNKIGQITPAGAITEFTIPTAGSNPFGIDVGTGGNDLVFAESSGNKIGRLVITAGVGGGPSTGAFSEFAIPTAATNPVQVVAGLDGNLYFTELLGNNIGRITPDGTVTEYPVPTAASRPLGLAYVPGPNATLLFTERSASQIGRVALPGVLNISAPTTVIEGQDRFATFTVTRSQGSNGPVSVNYATTPGTALSPENFTTTTGTIAFADGDTTPKTFTVPITGGTALHLLPNLTFSTTLSAPTGQATIGTPSATVQIIDSTPREVSVNDVTVNEAAGTATFTVSLNTGSGLPVTVAAQTNDGTAVAGQDYTAVAPTVLSFAPGVTTQTLTVPILDDAVFKANQTYYVTLSSPTNAVIARAQGTGVIVDNDAPVVVQGRTITPGENTPFTRVVASFSDPNGISPLASYSAIVNFGDGTPTSPGTITAIGNYFVVNATHTYAHEGTYAVATRILYGVTTSNVGYGQAIVADGALTAQVAALTPTANAPLTGNVASFQDGGGLEAASSYFATIDYGDGTPIAPGQVVAPAVAAGAPASTSDSVVGHHTFAAAGTYNVGVTVRSQGGSVITSYQAVTVTNPPPVAGFLSGFLNPASDSGVSNSDGITNVNQPNFEGFANPGATVKYFASVAGGTPIQIGQGAADASGFYSITSFNPLPDGTYTVVAAFSNVAGVSPTVLQVLPQGGKGPLVIDTVAPKVTGLSFNRLTGTLQLAFQDNLSGLDRAALVDGANYRLSSPHAPTSTTRVTGIAVPAFPASGSTATVPVTLTFNNGRKLKFGVYTLLARSGGIRDVAGNALDGEFYGTFPSGNGQAGGDFTADFPSFHRITRAPGSPNGSVGPFAGPVPAAASLHSRVAKARAVSHHAPISTIASRQVMFGKPSR